MFVYMCFKITEIPTSLTKVYRLEIILKKYGIRKFSLIDIRLDQI